VVAEETHTNQTRYFKSEEVNHKSKEVNEMHYTRRIVTLVLAVGLLLGGLAAVGEAGGTIRIAAHLDSLNLTPYNYVTGTPGYRKMTLVYDSLLYGDADNIPQPWLAETAELSEDGLVWTFKLHEGIKWHDREPFTAYDVKFTYEYYQQYPMGRFLGRTRGGKVGLPRISLSAQGQSVYTFAIHKGIDGLNWK